MFFLFFFLLVFYLDFGARSGGSTLFLCLKILWEKVLDKGTIYKKEMVAVMICYTVRLKKE